MKNRNGVIATLTTIVVVYALNRFTNERRETIDRDVKRLGAHISRTILSSDQLIEAQEVMYHKLLQMMAE